jgi:hypothetical protein
MMERQTAVPTVTLHMNSPLPLKRLLIKTWLGATI